MAERHARIAAEVAHVLFMDMVAFSRSSIEEQTRLVERLRAHVQSLPEYERAAARGDLICLDTGDGMALVFLRDPTSPLQCAVELSDRLAGDETAIALRMGIHTGPVSRTTDISGRQNVTGAGINMAQRVMSCADDGQILLSHAAAEMVGAFDAWTGRIENIGERAVKHGDRLILFGYRKEPDSAAAGAVPPADLPSAVAATEQRTGTPGGALALGSDYYVERPTDHAFANAVQARDSIVLVKGARQMGKTSLLARGLDLARASGLRVALTDFQTLSTPRLASPDALYQALAKGLAVQLAADYSPRRDWDDDLDGGMNLEMFLQRHVLQCPDPPFVWGLDEVDRLFGCSFASEVFGLLRSWHNRRALDPGGHWSRLTLAMAYATEAHLFITDLNQSPFNVGTRLTLDDFDVNQVAELNRRYASPLSERQDVERLWRLTGGQPYLTQCCLQQLSARGISMDRLEAEAGRDDGPFGDHLRRIVITISRDDALIDAVRSVLAGRPTIEPHSFFRLRSGGILTGVTPARASIRSAIYAAYLSHNLAT